MRPDIANLLFERLFAQQAQAVHPEPEKSKGHRRRKTRGSAGRATSIRWGILAFATASFVGCGSPPRPAGVPAGSTWVEGAKTGWWQQCSDLDAKITHCTIWNEGGEILLDEEFLPLDGGPPPPSDGLKLRGSGPCTGVYQVCLTNGRILLPQSRYDELKDFVRGKRP